MLMNMKKKEKDVFDWDSISIEKYYNIMEILEDNDDDITKNVRIVALILDREEQDIWNMGMDEAGDYISRLNFLGKFDLPKNPNMNIKLPGYDIKVMKDVTKINVAQYVDFQNFVKMPLKEGMEKILSVFLIPDGCRYNEGYDIIDLQKVIRENLSFRVAESLLGFFSDAVRGIISQFPTLLQKTDQESEESGTDGEDGEVNDGDTEEVSGFNSFNWLLLINRVSDRTKMSWDQIWDLGIFEFLNYLQFDIEYKKMEERELAKWKATH